MSDIFPIIVLNARPGAGKSEIIKYLKDMAVHKRKDLFHVGKLHVIDDFPYLWRWFEEDHLLSEMGKERLFTDEKGYFKYSHLWDLLIKMMNLEYTKFIRDTENSSDYTVIIEFSRGVQHGGYLRAYPHLSDVIVKKMAVLYVNVSWSESLRKNKARFNPDKPDSILEHGLPDEKLEYLYSNCDFKTITDHQPHFIKINGRAVPYAVFENEDDITTGSTGKIEARLKTCLDKLWEKTRV